MSWIRTTLGVAIAICIGSLAQADIFRWDTGGLIPGTAGITPGPGVNLSGRNTGARNLQFASLTGNMANARFDSSWLQSASFSLANLTGASLTNTDVTGAAFSAVTFDDANFTGAIVAEALFLAATQRGFTKEQLYSTASYQAKNLIGLGLLANDLTGWNFREQNLTRAQFRNAILTGADLTGAIVAGASFDLVTAKGFTKEQLHSTASYQQKDLSDMSLAENDLSHWDLSGQNLTNVSFSLSTLNHTNLSGAVITGASFNDVQGFTKEQLYATASYQQKNLQRIWLRDNDLTSWDFNGQNLTGAEFGESKLDNANFSDATINGTVFLRREVAGVLTGGLSKAQLYTTASYQQKNLARTFLLGFDLTDADLSGQNLQDAVLNGATLTNAALTGANIRGAVFEDTTSRGFTKEQFYSTASYQEKNLERAGLQNNDVAGWDFSGQNLTRTMFTNANVADANFAGATIAGANFERADGFTEEQLYSTASYQQKDLRGFSVSHNDVSGWDFSGQNLTNADFDDAIYVDTDLSFADTRGGQFFELSMPILRNTIEPDGIVAGLDLNDGERLVVGDYDAMAMADGSFLKLVFEADEWNSTISFDPGISVELGGVLELNFASDVNVASQVGRTFVAFDWTGVAPTGEFQIESPYVWDTSKLYTTGEITLQAVPEPASALLLFAAVPVAFAARSWRRHKIAAAK
jgi:uncharacterized protein YjbI with pentapeptide repeats